MNIALDESKKHCIMQLNRPCKIVNDLNILEKLEFHKCSDQEVSEHVEKDLIEFLTKSEMAGHLKAK